VSERRLDNRSQLVLAGACLAAFFTAFELKTPLFSIGPVSFTSSEIAGGILIIASLVFAAANFSWYRSRRALDVAVLLFAASNLISVAVAEDKSSALKFSLRMLFAVLVYIAVSRLPARSRSHLWIAGTLAVTLTLITVIGLMENFISFVEWPSVLEPFQEGIVTFGTFYNIRIASTLPYPTVLSMYLELTLPLAIAFGLWLRSRQDNRNRQRWIAAATVALITAVMIVQVVTFTRTAFFSTSLSFLAGAVMAYIYGYGRRFWEYLLLGVVILGLTLGVMTLFSNKMAVRLGVGEQETHYGVEYKLISITPEIEMGQQNTAVIHVKNTGTINWEPTGDNEVWMGYRWLTYPDKQNYELDPNADLKASSVPFVIPPGGEADIQQSFITPQEDGKYVLVFDLVKTHVSWFSSAGPSPLIIPLEFINGKAQPFTISETADNFKAGAPVLDTPTREQLWRAGYKTWKANPILGVGPDQFRFRYFNYMPELSRDELVRTHNIFLEALVNTGLIGLAVMIFLLARTVFVQFRLVHNRSQGWGARFVSLALLIAMIAYVIHGILDYFLWQTGITFLLFIFLGLTSWLYHEAGTGAGNSSVSRGP